jgi:hypothetical protein
MQAIKRSSSTISTSPEPTTPNCPPVTPSPKKAKPDSSPTPHTPSKPKKTPKPKTESSGNANGTWTPDKRGVFLDGVIAAGYKSVDLDGLASRVSGDGDVGRG